MSILFHVCQIQFPKVTTVSLEAMYPWHHYAYKYTVLAWAHSRASQKYLQN